jgi:adenosylcobinamide-phosphate synthase
MVGYKNEKYIFLGKFSAYMDDIFNFIPSRITALFMIFASFLLGYDHKSAFKIFIRDRKKHLSPNSAQTESVTAGALNIQLGGTHNYFGKPVEKETIGDNIRKAEYEDIKKSNKLMYVTSLIFLVTGILIRLIFIR